mmetsp:Transcript_101264/g.325421  ORF Transcript_101264/g.325421 Transcript_101264/m.325421 type:complete len:202 (-) Transcript_101264:2053-2658(-)
MGGGLRRCRGHNRNLDSSSSSADCCKCAAGTSRRWGEGSRTATRSLLLFLGALCQGLDFLLPLLLGNLVVLVLAVCAAAPQVRQRPVRQASHEAMLASSVSDFARCHAPRREHRRRWHKAKNRLRHQLFGFVRARTVLFLDCGLQLGKGGLKHGHEGIQVHLDVSSPQCQCLIRCRRCADVRHLRARRQISNSAGSVRHCR